MTTITYPDAIALQRIEQEKLPRLTAQRPVFDIFPMEDSDDYVLAWEQEDSYQGLQAVRGLNGAPPRIKKQGAKRFIMEPGVYGEFELIDERELTRRRQWGTLDALVNADDLVMSAQDRLLQRRLDRIEVIIWTLLTTGTFAVADVAQAVVHTDSYTTQTYSAPVTWATAATAAPLADFRAVKLLARGHGVRFDQTARAYMNSATANALYANNNPADLGRTRLPSGATINSPDQFNQLMSGAATGSTGENLPQIVEYDEGYLDESNTFQLFIPNNKVVVVGARTSGAPIGRYAMVRNANNPNMAPGAYSKVIDHGEDAVPRSIEVHDGHSGGCELWFPSAIVVMTV